MNWFLFLWLTLLLFIHIVLFPYVPGYFLLSMRHFIGKAFKMIWGLGWQDLFQRVFMLDSGKCLCLILAGGYTQWQYNFNLILLQGFKEFKLITIPRGSGFMILTYMKDLPRYLFVSCGPDEAQAGIKIAGRNINNLRYADDTTVRTESEEELKSLLMKVK